MISDLLDYTSEFFRFDYSARTGQYRLQVQVCESDDPEYVPLATRIARAALASEGKITFKTCAKQAKVPVAFIDKLIQQPYPTNSTPPFLSFEQAFDHWLLSELISCIGAHTIL